MDVRCERCKTEYEFDDALVSGRGTTVRCTNCGHQFKVRRAAPGDTSTPQPVEEQWIVTTTTGERLVYKSLRELQRAILGKRVGRSDTLQHGAAPARLLGSIAELEPFFEGRTTSSRPPPAAGADAMRLPGPPRAPSGTDPGVGVTFPKRAAGMNPRERTEPYDSTRPAPMRTPVPPSAGAPEPARPRIDTLRPASAVPPPTAPPVQAPPQAMPPTTTQIMGSSATPRPAPAFPTPPPSEQEPPTLQRPPRVERVEPIAQMPEIAPEVSSPLPPPTVPRRRQISSIDEEHMNEAMRASLPSIADEPYGAPRRRRLGGWLVALLLVGGVGTVGWIVARPYIGQIRPAPSAQQLDPRVAQFLGDGEKALADGNLDLAKENFDKASALAEKEPRLLVDVARLAAARADVDWLRIRLLPKDAAADQKDTQARLDELRAKAKTAAEAAIAVAPEDPQAIRAKIDALRIAGERDAARALVAKIINGATQPETAYVLAALDLAEPEPSWPTTIQRLRLAAQGEGNVGRARAALVYALARSGDKEAAKQELGRLQAMTRPHPLASLLAAFVDKAQSKPDAGPSPSASTVDVNALPSAQLPSGALANDGRTPLQQAADAIRSGDTGRARAIYQAMLANNPGDSQALCGMGDVERASGNTSGAINYYKQVIASNPNYLPALIGLADLYYGSGNQGAAIALYKQIVDNFPEGSYPGYVKDRAGASAPPPQASPSASAAPTATATETASAPATTTAAPTASAPAPSPSPAPTPTSTHEL